uniref:hypothetical protein n=1 Tax=Oceaniferula marina TaxID=2748318 RepID=UPI001D0453F1
LFLVDMRFFRIELKIHRGILMVYFRISRREVIFLQNVKHTGRDVPVAPIYNFPSCKPAEKPGQSATSGRVLRLVGLVVFYQP